MVARLTPDQKAACSNHVGVKYIFIFSNLVFNMDIMSASKIEFFCHLIHFFQYKFLALHSQNAYEVALHTRKMFRYVCSLDSNIITMVSVSTVQPSINLEFLCFYKSLKMSLYTLF
jgi:hypothetical protein